jgi:hypothetical protein
VYGLRALIDAPLGGLMPAAGDGPIDLTVHIAGPRAQERLPSAAEPGWVPTETLGNGDASSSLLMHKDGRRLLRFTGERVHALEFLIDADGRSVACSWSKPVARLAGVDAVLLGVVLHYVLQLRGETCLHAGAVRMGPGAIAIAGEQGAGKSTTIAGLARRGYPVLSDDLAVLDERDGQCWVQPGMPRLRLAPDALDHLGQEWRDLAVVLSSEQKRYLPLHDIQGDGGWRFQPTAVPLQAIYLLGDFEPGLDGPVIVPVAAATAVAGLLPHTYHPLRPLSIARRAESLNALCRLVGRVAVRSLRRPPGLDRLPDALDAIMADHASLAGVTGETHAGASA